MDLVEILPEVFDEHQIHAFLIVLAIQRLATTLKRPSHGLTVSPDERWLVYGQNDQEGMDLMLVEDFR